MRRVISRPFMESLKKENFRKIQIADRNLFMSHLAIQDSLSCECNFANLICWGGETQLRFTEFRDRLLIYSMNEKYLFFPIGEYFPPEELFEIMQYLRQQDMVKDCYDVPEKYIKQFPEISDYFSVSLNEDYFDYIHETASLVTLTGKKLRKKRNHLKQFQETFPNVECLEMSCDNSWECKELGMRLNLERTEDLTMHKETVAIQFAFQYFKELELEGLVIKVKDNVIAFAIFSKLNSKAYDIHFEKADHNYKGTAQYINFKIAEHLQEKCHYLNREQDLGLKGLRRAKRSYAPAFMYQRYELKTLI
jgi:uncharacterized protein